MPKKNPATGLPERGSDRRIAPSVYPSGFVVCRSTVVLFTPHFLAMKSTLNRWFRSFCIFLTRPSADQGGGLTPASWSAAGYGDTDPVAPNDSDSGRQQNRRVELVVLPNVEEMLNLDDLVREVRP